MFQTLHDSAGHQISLTSSHLIYVKEKGYVKSSSGNVGDSLQIFSATLDRLVDFKVSRVNYELKRGYIAPLTNQGTLLVNGVLASCYAEINSHYLADVAMTPLKLWHQIAGLIGTGHPINQNLQSHDINSYAHFLSLFSKRFLPETLFS